MKRLTTKTKNALRQVRHGRVRPRVQGTKERPRLSVFRSLRGITAQLVDDTAGKTVCYVGSTAVKGATKVEGKTSKVAQAFVVGKTLAEKAKEKGISKVVFDRGGYEYHGRVQAVADGARAGGLEF
ncbi:MAG TPA: 50S ribosomal protein L18 [Patescibacteria group bacterium]|nr:50S ribosomal protein L18 [Patescibacteria group bacterium]